MDASGNSSIEYGFNAASVGSSVNVIRLLGKWERTFKVFGSWKYWIGAAISNVIFTSSINLSLNSKELQYDFKNSYLMVFGNGEYFGGGMKVCPASRIDDGLANVTILHGINKFYIFSRLSSDLVSGHHINHRDRCKYFQTAELRVESPEGITFEIELDGDLIGVGPATFSILPSAIKVFKFHQ